MTILEMIDLNNEFDFLNTMILLQDIRNDISNLIGFPLVDNNVRFDKPQLESILRQLQQFNVPKNFSPIGIKPVNKIQIPEYKTHYRSQMSKYIMDNTGVDIPVDSTVNSRFYDSVANYLGL